MSESVDRVGSGPATSAATRPLLADSLACSDSGRAAALRFLQQLRLAVAPLDPFRLMRFVEHAALH
jgi:hypothetical protein